MCDCEELKQKSFEKLRPAVVMMRMIPMVVIVCGDDDDEAASLPCGARGGRGWGTVVGGAEAGGKNGIVG